MPARTKVRQVVFYRYFVKDNRAIVEGINVVSKHTKPNAKNPQGGIERRKLLFIFLTLTWLTRNLVKLHVSAVS